MWRLTHENNSAKTIWTKKMRKSIQGQVKNVSNFQNLFFWKQRHVSEAEFNQFFLLGYDAGTGEATSKVEYKVSYSCLLKIFKILDWDGHFSIFWNFWGLKISKIRDSHFVDLGHFQELYLMGIFKHSHFYRPWRHKIRPIAKNFRPILIFVHERRQI